MWTIISRNDETGTPWNSVMFKTNDYAEIVKAWHKLHRKHGRMISKPVFNGGSGG